MFIQVIKLASEASFPGGTISEAISLGEEVLPSAVVVPARYETLGLNTDHVVTAEPIMVTVGIDPETEQPGQVKDEDWLKNEMTRVSLSTGVKVTVALPFTAFCRVMLSATVDK